MNTLPAEDQAIIRERLESDPAWRDTGITEEQSGVHLERLIAPRVQHLVRRLALKWPFSLNIPAEPGAHQQF